MIFSVNSVEETTNLGITLGKLLKSGDIVCLTGDLGTGKTHITKGIAKGLEITDYITSPTFTIVNEYDSGRLKLNHFDVYRVSDPDEIYAIGFDDYIFSDAVSIIEWANYIEEILPKDFLHIYIEKDLEKGEDYRSLKKSFVIFVCTFDLFGQGRHVYTFENRCVQDLELPLSDDTVKIILNTKGILDDVSVEMKSLLDYIDGKEPEDDFTKELDDAVNEVRDNEKWRLEYMTLQMSYQEKYELGVQDGIELGREQGIEQGIDKINRLHDILIEQNRLDDLKRAIKDKEFEKSLMKELL